jgi:hypothetical protein
VLLSGVLLTLLAALLRPGQFPKGLNP